MPIYVYRCLVCEETFKQRHGMSEVCNKCTLCDANDPVRVPSSFTNLSKEVVLQTKVGDLTKEFIENSKEDFKSYKENLEDKR